MSDKIKLIKDICPSAHSYSAHNFLGQSQYLYFQLLQLATCLIFTSFTLQEKNNNCPYTASQRIFFGTCFFSIVLYQEIIKYMLTFNISFLA